MPDIDVNVVEVGEDLLEYARFAMRNNWDYSRTHETSNPIKYIRYEEDFTGYGNPLRRLLRAAEVLWVNFFNKPALLDSALFGGGKLPLITRVKKAALRAKLQLRTDPHIPDGVLANGSIITFWEEQGEYIQLMQPSVGSLVAEFLKHHPEHPYAIKIAKELNRIDREYDDRIRRGKVT